MDTYDPLCAPDPGAWLALDEGERILLVERYHEEAGEPVPEAGMTVHATIHVVVENQVAEGMEIVAATLERLVAEGLDRHDAVHAVGAVLSEEMFRLLQEEDAAGFRHAWYAERLNRLTAAGWRQGKW